ncbi:MAG: hypothetical protein EZS28_034384, partial [Streblomastix strix]
RKAEEERLKKIALDKKMQEEEEKRKKEEEERKRLEEERLKEEEEKAKYVRGVVKFSHIAVRDLPKKDIIGSADPFVLIRMGEDEKQTSVAHNTVNYDYQNEQYEFIYEPTKMKGNGKVHFEVYDYDYIGNNDLIGTAIVDILPALEQPMYVELFLQPKEQKKDGLIDEENVLKLLNLQQDKGIGKVTFQMVYAPKDTKLKVIRRDEMKSARSQRDQLSVRGSYEKKEDTDFVKGTVKIKLNTLRDLPEYVIQEKKDVFILLMLGQKDKKSKVARAENEIIINQEFVLDFDPEKIAERDLFVEVWVKKEGTEGDELEGGEFVAGVAVEFLDFLQNPQNLDLQLIADTDEEPDEFSGEVSLNIVYLPENPLLYQ